MSIMDKVKDGSEEIRDVWEKTLEEVGEGFDEAKEENEGKVGTIKKVWEKTLEEVGEGFDEAKEDTKDKAEELKK